MKKLIVVTVVCAMFLISIQVTKASTINDIMAKVVSLQKQVAELQSQLTGLVLSAVKTVAPSVLPATLSTTKTILPTIVTPTTKPIATFPIQKAPNPTPPIPLNLPPCLVTSGQWIQLLSPNGGETYMDGEQTTITWASCHILEQVNIYLEIPSSNTSITLVSHTLNDGTETITLPTILPAYGTIFKVRIERDTQTLQHGAMLITDSSNNLFTITNADCIADWNNGNDTNAGTSALPKKHIQACIDAVQSGDTVIARPGTYIENINFNGKNITVASNFLYTHNQNDINNTIIDGNQNGSVVTIASGENNDAVLTGFTIQNGNAVDGGGIFVTGGATSFGLATPVFSTTPKLSYLKIINNVATESGGSGGGGGIYIFNTTNDINYPPYYYNNTPVIMENLEVSNNVSYFDAGGIFASAAVVSLKNISLTGNSAFERRGGIHLEGIDVVGDIDKLYILRNYAPNQAAGQIGATLHNSYSASNIKITNSVIAQNIATTKEVGCNNGNWCGGLYVSMGYDSHTFSSTMDIVNSTFTDNKTRSNRGGGLCISTGTEKGKVNVINSVFRGNTKFYGATGMTEQPIQILLEKLPYNIPNASLAYNDIEGLISGVVVDDPTIYPTIIPTPPSIFGQGNIDSLNPLFTDPTNGDYSISNLSPVAGQGINNITIAGQNIIAPFDDILGAFRPNPANTNVDMGAYEVGISSGNKKVSQFPSYKLSDLQKNFLKNLTSTIQRPTALGKGQSCPKN